MKFNGYKESNLTSRVDINLGYNCNNNCLFCYFRDRKDKLFVPGFAHVKRRLQLARKLGIRTVEFTGGEATLRDDIFELISFAKKELRFKGITVITNGTRFCDKNFAIKAKESGVDEILVSIHGHDAKLHNHLSGRSNAFEEAKKAITTALESGISCRTNTVINKFNFDKISDIAGMLTVLGVRKMNYIFFSPLDDAYSAEKELWLRYSEAAPFVQEMLNEYRKTSIDFSIKIIPFCFLNGCEGYITDLFQNLYDPYEWDYYTRVALRRGLFLANVAAFGGMFLLMDIMRMLEIGVAKSLREGIMRVEALRQCVKPKVCRQCKFDLICPGIWKPYASNFGLGEIKPIKGNKINCIDSPLFQRFAEYYQTGAL